MATGINGQTINISDQVSIVGLMTAQSGTGSTAQITVETQWSPATFVAAAHDLQATEHSADANHTAISFSGRNFGQPQDAVCALGTVTAISGSGTTATLTVVLVSSLMTITVPAGACASAAV
jgi:hypothetical protein